MLALKTVAFAVVALVLGVIGLSMSFSDIGPGESTTSRIALGALFFFICGLGIGYFNPRAWIISGLSAWAGVLMGGFLVIGAIRTHGVNALAAQEPPYIAVGLALLLVPLGLSLLGGHTGKRLSNKRGTQSAS